VTPSSLILFLGILASQGSSPRPNGDLLPEEGAFAGIFHWKSHIALSEMLLPDDRERKSAVVVLPSFEAEWAVFVTAGPTGRQVVLRALRKPLSAESAKVPSKDPNVMWIPVPGTVDPKGVATAAKHVAQTSAPLSDETARKLELAWQAALARVRYTEEMQRALAGADGTSYHFSQCGQQGCFTGRTWSPEGGSIAHGIVEVAEAMRSYVVARRVGKDSALLAKIELLMGMIRSRE